MIELCMYSGRLGNCMFAYAYARLLADMLGVRVLIPKGTEILGFPKIATDAKDVVAHNHMYETGAARVNPRTLIRENDNMRWFMEKSFQSQKIEDYSDQMVFSKILNEPDIHSRRVVVLGNYELGEIFAPFKNKLQDWFTFPTVDLSRFEFFTLDEPGQYFKRHHFISVQPTDLVISLRLEDYTSDANVDRLLDFEYFRIILESRKFNRVYIITNPSSIGHNREFKYLDAFRAYDPIFVRVDDPVMSMAFGAQFENIAISQSTYSWWLAFLSNAKTVYYPLSKRGPFSLIDEKYPNCDLRVPFSSWRYVNEATRTIMPDDAYRKIDYQTYSWKP